MRKPSTSIPTAALEFQETTDGTRVTWYGHSTFLLEMNGKRLLFDPMFSPRSSPVSWVGPKRYPQHPSIQSGHFNAIDAIVLSHDHYDHLDYASIQQLKGHTRRFIVPMGVRNRLIRWGVPAERISEHAWWDAVVLDGLTLTCLPARHFSGRGLFNRNSTLWCAWGVVGPDSKVFYSGDSGYGPHFKQIGEHFGWFDVTLLECGQYDERWAAIHMLPEQTLQAHLDLKGQLLIPVHWAAFTLAYHAWVDPAERLLKAAQGSDVSVLTPKVGQSVLVPSDNYPTTPWWR